MKIADNTTNFKYPPINLADSHTADKILKPSDNLNSSTFIEASSVIKTDIKVLSFWFAYFCLVIISSVNTVISACREKNTFIIYIYIATISFIVAACFVAYKYFTKKKLIFLAVLTCLHLVITDLNLYASVLDPSQAAASSLQTLILALIIFSYVLERKIIVIIFFSSGIIALSLILHNTESILRTAIEFCILFTLCIFIYLQKYSKVAEIEAKDDDYITPLEEILSQLFTAINNLSTQVENCRSCRDYMECSIQNILNATNRLQTCKNIYATRLEKITKNMDEEDKAFIEQIAEESSSFKSFEEEPRHVKRITTESALYVSKLGGVLKSIGKDWNFNTFFLQECSEGCPLEISGLYITSRFNLDSIFKLDRKFEEFLKDLESKYLKNPYHNSCHGADVMSSYVFFLSSSGLLAHCTELELLSGILATLGHDVGHPAKNNRFLVMAKDAIAIQYNDISVLENLHSTILFQIIQSTDILSSLSYEQWCVFRKLSIEMILATDMSKHFDLLETFKTKYAFSSDLSKADVRFDLFKIIVKAADIGHAAKTIELHKKWCFQVIEEFFSQGDEEKALGLPVSMYCDRETTVIGKSQAGFIKNIVVPLYSTLNAVLGSKVIEEMCIKQLEENKAYWESIMMLSRGQTFVGNIETDDTGVRRRSTMPLKQN